MVSRANDKLCCGDTSNGTASLALGIVLYLSHESCSPYLEAGIILGDGDTYEEE